MREYYIKTYDIGFTHRNIFGGLRRIFNHPIRAQDVGKRLILSRRTGRVIDASM